MSAPMRLLLTTDAVGGVWQYSIDLARALGERGVETLVALLGPAPDAGQRAGAENVEGATLIETGLPLDWLCDGPEPVLAAGNRIAELAQDLSADIVQLNMPTLGAAASPRVPVIAVTHGCVSTWWRAARPGVPLDPAYRWHHTLMREGLHAADRVVAPTASYASVLARHYGMRRAPDVIHNGRSPLAPLKPAPMHDCALTVGRLWDRVKGAELLDRVAARLAVPFHAAGAVRGPHGETVRLDNLHLLGHLDGPDLARQLAARPVFVSAAAFEPFGLAVLEAAAAGCALVLSDIATFRELWDDAALFISRGDEKAYAEAVDGLIGDPARRLALGDAARARAMRYTPAAAASAMLDIYTRTIAARAPSGRAAA